MSETVTQAQNTTEAASSSQQTASTETAATLLGTETKTEQAASEQTQATETKTEATKAEEKTETTTDAKVGAPEKYEFAEADKYDATILGTFSEAAKEANLTQDAAQKFLEKVAPAVQARTDEQVKAVHQQWTEASTADKEFGGEKLKENLGVAQKALKTFGSPELRTFLESTGLGSHPEVIRMLYRAGKAISEDGFVAGTAGAKSTVNPAAVLYDQTAK